jgi:hypothetical protein
MDASSPTPDAENPEMGLGDGCALTDGTRDVRLLALALTERWPMSPEAKAMAIRRLERVVSNPETKPRAFYVALKALAGLSRINLQAVDTSIRAKASEEVDERLAEIEKKIGISS